jgi:hypothetical protein
MQAVVWLVVVVLALGTSACRRAEPVSDPPVPEALQKNAEALRAAGGSTGFICGVNKTGTITCICDDNAPPGSPESCDGMEKICGLLGTGSICRPETGWCICTERRH